jgi:hypothetical protein
VTPLLSAAQSVASHPVLKEIIYGFESATWDDYPVFTYNTFSYILQYFYLNVWGDGYSSSYWYSCDDSIRKPFYYEDLG